MQKKHSFSILSPLLFWGYNGIFFLGLILFGIQFATFSGLFIARFMTTIPLNVAVMAYILLLTPIACSILAYKIVHIRNDRVALMKLFFGVELPIIGLAFLRIMFIREMTPVLWFFFISMLISIAGLLLSLIRAPIKTKIRRTLHFLSQEIAVLLAGYAALLVLFFLPIIAVLLLKGVFSIDYAFLAHMFFQTAGLILVTVVGGLILFSLTFGLFFLTPVVTTVIYWKAFRELKNNLKHNHGLTFTRSLMYGFGALYLLMTLVFSMQTNTSSYANQLQTIRSATTFEEKQALAATLLKDGNAVRQALTDTYLSPYRYVADANINMIRNGYVDQIGFDDKTAVNLQQFFNTLAAPFIFHGNFKEDVARAAKDYEEIFDANIQEGEKSTILGALNGTNTHDEVKAGLLDKNKKSVLVTEQTVTATTYNQDLLARVEFEETYRNISDEPQEVYYQFSLPEDAVLTDLRLGPDLEYKAQIAPKGAARTTYENQVRINVDPALLEQTGPRQYRLRVFPVPAPLDFPERQRLTAANNGAAPEEKPQRVLMEYVTFRTNAGIPLPAFTEARNAFADGSTKRKYVLNGREIPTKDSNPVIPLEKVLSACPDTTFRNPLPNSLSATAGSLYFLPHTKNPMLPNYPCTDSFDANKINGSTFALLLDVSYSNKDRDWNDYLKNTLNIVQLLQNNNVVDIYYFNDHVSQKLTLTKEILDKGLPPVTGFGKTNRLQAITDAASQREFGGYAAIFMITDGSDFDGETDPDPKLNIYDTPIYMIHPDGRMPQYSDELTNAVIRSGGAVVTDPLDAFRHFWLKTTISALNDQTGGISLYDVNDYGAWVFKSDNVTVPGSDIRDANNDTLLSDRTKVLNILSAESQTSSSEFELIASKKMISAAMKDMDAMEVLGKNPLAQIHSLATEKFIVTPYSSMIALVNDWQKDQLARAEAGKNPFATQYDAGGERLDMPAGGSMLNIGAVPEPHEWALIFISLLLMTYFYRKPVLEFARNKFRRGHIRPLQ